MIDLKGVISSIIGALISSFVSVLFDVIKNSYSADKNFTVSAGEITVKALIIAFVAFVVFIVGYNEIKKQLTKTNSDLVNTKQKNKQLETEKDNINEEMNQLISEKEAMLEEINQLKTEMKSLNNDLKYYKDVCSKNANLLSQLQGVESAKVRKIFDEFNRTPYEKLFSISIEISIDIVKSNSSLYNVNYTWRFKGKALKDLSVPTFRRGVSSDQKIKKETLNLVVKRKVNNKEVEILYNDERGYNIRYLSFSTFELDLEVFVAQFLRKNDIFDIEISYTLVDNYNPQGDYFYIFPFTFDDAICKDLSIEIISNDCIITEALLEYVNEGTEMVDTKTMRKIGEKYSLMFNPSLENKAQGFYKISTDSDNN